ncbi:MAG TPA: DUF433 domain-containing protein [Pirellulaceae bacterium]|jgi:uncharacterized protein (DUF433 family)
MAPSTNTIAAHIIATPGTCGGVPRIDGSRIRVSQIVLMTEQGMSADEIVSNFPHLTLAQVYAALSYYHDHRAQIDDEIRAADEQFRHLKSQIATAG